MNPRRALLACIGVLLFALKADAQVELRYKHKAGEKRTYLTEQKMNMKMNVRGMDIETKVDQTIEISWETKKVDDRGVADMEMRVDRVKMSLDSFGGAFEVDSAALKDAKGPVEKVLNQVVATLATAKIKLRKDALGNISDVEIPEDVLKKLRDIPDAGAGESLNESTFRGMTEGGIIFPMTIAKGKSWEQKQKIDLPVGKMTGETKYTYEGQEDRGDRKVEKIAFVPEMKLEPDMNAKFKVAIKKGDGKGTVYFDNKTGTVLEQNMEVNMQMEIEVGGMAITQNVVQNTTVRLKEGK